MEPNVNNFKQYKDYKIPKDQTIIFQLLNIKPDPQNQGRMIIPMTMIRSEDKIYVDGAVQQIAFIQSVNQDGTYVIDRNIKFTSDTGGCIFCQSGVARDEELAAFLTFSNGNQSNPFRDKNTEPIFRLVDPKREAMDKFELAKQIGKAKQIVYDLNEEEVLLAGKFFEMFEDNAGSIGLALLDLAEKNPTEIERYLAEKKSVKTEKEELNVIKDLIKKGTFVVTPIDGTISYGNQVLYNLPEGASKPDFSEFLKILQLEFKEIYTELIK